MKKTKSKGPARRVSPARTHRAPRATVLTHGPFCLDGMAAAVTLARFYGPERTRPIFAHPSELDGLIEEVSRSAGPPQDLWITDITWKDPRSEAHLKTLLDKKWRVFWVDHHTIAMDKGPDALKALGFSGTVASDRYSAARLLYNFLAESKHLFGPPSKKFREFKEAVLMADDNDRWIHRRPGSRELAMTVAALGGMDAYRELLKVGPSLNYTPRMKESLVRASRELAISTSLAARTRIELRLDRHEITLIVALCHGYTSEVADSLSRGLTHPEPKAIFLLYNLEDGRISIRRTPACEINLSRLAARFGGGGHPAAAGFDLPEARNHLQTFLANRLIKALEE